MKAILMSTRPHWVKEILNGNKTIEIRKKFPKDYVGWVYIYCTKGKRGIFKERHRGYTLLNQNKWIQSEMNGKVVARFWCDKVEEIKQNDNGYYYCDSLVVPYGLQKFSCLTQEELHDYLRGNKGYAIHITKLEIFDKPREISEFKYYKKFSEVDYMLPIPRKETCERLVTLTRAPQSWCYIEI